MVHSGLSSLLWFIAIIVFIPIALWLFKRTPLGGSAAHGVMRSIAALPLSPSQRVVTVEVGQGDQRRWLVLGVTAQNITTLHTMQPQDEPVAESPVVTPFAQLLGRFRRDLGNTGER